MFESQRLDGDSFSFTNIISCTNLLCGLCESHRCIFDVDSFSFTNY